MMIHKVIPYVAVALCCSDRALATSNVFFSGVQCQIDDAGGSPPDLNDIGFSEHGVTNVGPFANLRVSCPLDWQGSQNSLANSTTLITYRDNISQNQVNVECHREYIDQFGNFGLGGSKYGCSTAGGCTSNPGIFVSPVNIHTYITLAGVPGNWVGNSISCQTISQSYIVGYYVTY